MPDPQATAAQNNAVRFYENHPINEQQILHDLARDGIALEGLTEETLKDYDQDHFGGLEAVDVLAGKAGIRAGMHVLDVCSGMGGPARYLAARLGCRVTGLDIAESRHQGAIRLTGLVGLEHRVDFRLGSALEMPFPAASFDVVIGQEAWVHVPEKEHLIAECARVVKPGGRIAFTDIMRGDHLTPAAAERVQREMAFASFETPGRLCPVARGPGLHGGRAGRSDRLVGRDPGAAAGDVSKPARDHHRALRHRSLSKMGRHLCLLRRLCSPSASWRADGWSPVQRGHRERPLMAGVRCTISWESSALCEQTRLLQSTRRNT